jgi:deazaflavin-dependent oxidoreductase (nitroreductase family)
METTFPSSSNPYSRWLIRLPLIAYRMGLGDFVRLLHLLVLTTRRSSGQPRFTPLEYRRHGKRMYIISARGEKAGWVQNILKEPAVTVQRGGETFSACAELVQHPGERLMALRLFHGRVPFLYDSLFTPMKALRGRSAVAETGLPAITENYTLVRLTPQPEVSTLPTLGDDLRWIPPTIAAGAVALTVFAVFVVVGQTVAAYSRHARKTDVGA